MSVFSNWLKCLIFRTSFARFICFRYRMNFFPSQLAFWVECIDKTADVSGMVMEIGCFEGGTTVYLKKHMDYKGINKPYIAIDTFSGFLEPHIQCEVKRRGKSEATMKQGFSSNNKEWFEKTMEINQLGGVTCIQADAASFDYTTLGAISFALIDLDLYQPIKEALERIWPLLSPNGMIIVDDCVKGTCYDGALEAYQEFMKSHDLASVIVHTKLGVITKHGMG